MDKDKKIYLILVVIVALIISGIYLYNSINKENPEERLMKCIAKNTDMIYLSKTCSHCANQKKILGEYLSLFKVTDCFYESEKCIEADIPGYPTWIINGKQYPGEKTIDELQQLTQCECALSDNITDSPDKCETNESCINSLESSCESNLSK
jgi:hypothetical protein